MKKGTKRFRQGLLRGTTLKLLVITLSQSNQSKKQLEATKMGLVQKEILLLIQVSKKKIINKKKKLKMKTLVQACNLKNKIKRSLKQQMKEKILQS